MSECRTFEEWFKNAKHPFIHRDDALAAWQACEAAMKAELDAAIEKAKADLLKPGPCGKHPRACWEPPKFTEVHWPASHTFPVKINSRPAVPEDGHCTVCAKIDAKPTLEAPDGFKKSHA